MAIEVDRSGLFKVLQVCPTYEPLVVVIVEKLTSLSSSHPLNGVYLFVLLEAGAVGQGAHGEPIDLLDAAANPVPGSPNRSNDSTVESRFFEDLADGGFFRGFPFVGASFRQRPVVMPRTMNHKDLEIAFRRFAEDESAGGADYSSHGRQVRRVAKPRIAERSYRECSTWISRQGP